MSHVISVIIPVRQRPSELKRCVGSVLAQSYPDFELMVVNDGSPPAIYEGVEQLLSDKGHKVFHRSWQGVSAARNFGVSQSRGDWVAFLDSDDLWYPQKLERQLEFHLAHPEILVSQTEEVWIRRGKRVNRKKYHILASGECFSDCVKACAISPSSVMMKRSLFEALGGFDERMNVCEDYELWLRLSLNHQVGLVAEPLIEKHGGHADQLSKSEAAIDRFRIFALLKTLAENALSCDQRHVLVAELRRKVEILTPRARERQPLKSKMVGELESFLAELRENPELPSKDLRTFSSELLKRVGSCLLGSERAELWKSDSSLRI